MHCTSCHTSVPDKSKFCPSCGTGVDSSTVETSEADTSVDKKAEDKKNESIGGVIVVVLIAGWWFWSSSPADIDVSYCEHRISACEWDNGRMASCTFTNEAQVPVSLTAFKTWSYSSSGVSLGNMSIGYDSVAPGRSAEISLFFDDDAEKAYICSMDPESEIGRAVTRDHLKPLSIG